MQAIGQILKSKREEKNLTLDEVEKAIKVKKKFLKLLEENNLQKLPSAAYARGFVKNYAQFLELPSEKILAIFRRQFKAEEQGLPFNKLREEGFSLRVTPEMIRGGLFLILLLLFFGYLFRQYQSLTFGPQLSLVEPQKNLVSHTEKITIKGKTEPDIRVYINDEEIYPNETGEFAQEISLSKGTNQVVVVAENKAGKRKTVVREITFEPL